MCVWYYRYQAGAAVDTKYMHMSDILTRTYIFNNTDNV